MINTPRILLAAAALALAAMPAIAQDNNAGQLLFNNACRTCHTLRQGDNRLGPNLHGIIGRKAGSVANFPYSEAMKSSDIVWDDSALLRFIEDPEAVVSGNGMKPYTGVRSAEDRAKIVAFLKSPGK
jgi:cytochrome c